MATWHAISGCIGYIAGRIRARPAELPSSLHDTGYMTIWRDFSAITVRQNYQHNR